VRIHKLESAPGFIVFDLEGASTSVGVTRLAPKVLTDSAELLARSTTYAFATFGIDNSGASAGINSTPEQRDQAIAAFIEEVQPMVAEGRFLTSPGLGLTEADLAPLRAIDPRPEIDEPGLVAAGAMACATAVLGSLAGRTASILGASVATSALTNALAEVGASVSADGLGEVVFAGGKAGSIDHDTAGGLRAKVVVPVVQVPVTAKALAVLSRAGTVVMPDFVSLAAPLLAWCQPDGDPVAKVRTVAEAIAGEGTGAWMVAAGIAEAHLLTWQDALPFGRPLA
jgi:glutamate dehydrogenase/leucine dehydrogenase